MSAPNRHNTAADQLERLKNNDEYLDNLSIRLSLIESGTSQHFPHWRESIFNFTVAQWIEALQTNNSVEHVTLDMSVSENTLWQERTIGSFLTAVSAIPSLEKLIIRQNTLGSPRAISSLPAIRSAIENARCLTHLEIWGTNIATNTGDDLEALARVVENKKQVRSFKSAGFQLDESHVRALLPVLQNRAIKELWLGNTSDGYQPLLERLSSNNRTLETLILGFNRHLDDALCDKITELLKSNNHLRSLSLLNTNRANRASGISKPCFKSLKRLMEQNHTLVELKTSGQPNADIEFFSKLNRAGRKKLFSGQTTRSDWMDVMCAILEEEEEGGRLEYFFYILLLNPCLCEV